MKSGLPFYFHFEIQASYRVNSPKMLHDAKINYVIIGHSERRTIFHESSEDAARKTKAALEVGIKVILCVGETLGERESGSTNKVVQSQLKPVIDTLTEKEWR